MVLLVLSVLSLMAAVFFALLTWYVVREDRRRSAARVAALASDALDERATTVRAADAAAAGFMVRDTRSIVSGHPLVRVAVGVAMSVALIVFIAMSGDRREPPRAPDAPAVAARQEGSLELLSMRHDREGDALTVTGLVRNAGTTATSSLTAVVFAFDRSGNFIASGRAPLEFVTLAPGDESPFQVTVPHVSDVGRYRVSFRTDTGVVRHVDRRAPLEASAR